MGRQPNAEQLMLFPQYCAEGIEILEGRRFYSAKGEEARERKTRAEDLERFVNEQDAPGLVEVFALLRAPGTEPESNLGKGTLNSYLRQDSPWLDDVFTFSGIITDGALEIPIGQSSEWVTAEATQRLADALAAIPRPKRNPRLGAEFDNLRKNVTRALEESGLVLVLTVA